MVRNSTSVDFVVRINCRLLSLGRHGADSEIILRINIDDPWPVFNTVKPYFFGSKTRRGMGGKCREVFE